MCNLFIRELWGSTSLPAAGLCRDEASSRPLAQKVPFHLRQRGHDVKEEAARGRRRVDPIGERTKCDAVALQILDERDELPNSPPKSVELPNDKGITRPQV